MREINFPDEVSTMLFVLLGTKPLQARENLAYDSRELYLEYGRGLRELREAIRQSVSDASTNLPPDVAKRYIEGLSLLTDDGGVDHIQRMIDQLDDLAMGQVDHSMKIQASKWEIIAEITMLLIELALLAALAAFTGGTSLSQMALARARSRLAVLLIIHRLVRLARFGPTLGGALEEAIQALAVRLAQIALNPPGRRPDGIDWGDIGKAAAFGAVAGGFEGLLEGAGNHVRKWFNKNFDDFSSKFDDFAKNNPYTANVLKQSVNLPEVFVVSAVSEGAAETLVNYLIDGKLDWNWDTFIGAGAAGTVAVLGMSAVGGAGLWLHGKFSATDQFTDYNELPPSYEDATDTGGTGPHTSDTVPKPGLTGVYAANGSGAGTGGSMSTVTSSSDLYTPGAGNLPDTGVGGPLPVYSASSGTVPPPGGTPYTSPTSPTSPTSAPPVTSAVDNVPAGGSGAGTDFSTDPSTSVPPSTNVPSSATTPYLPVGTGGTDTGTGSMPAAVDLSSDVTRTRSTGSESDSDSDMSTIADTDTNTNTDTLTDAVTDVSTHAGTATPNLQSLPGSSPPNTALGSGAVKQQPVTDTVADGPVNNTADATDSTNTTDTTDTTDTTKQHSTEAPAAPVAPVGHGPAWEAARSAAVPVTRSHTWVDPLSSAPDPARPGETTQFTVRSKFDARRFQYDGEWVTDLTVQIGSRAPEGLPQEVWDKVRTGVEELLNAPAYRLPNGDLLHVTVERVAHDPHPHGLNVALIGPDRQMTRTHWPADADPVDYVHEITHQLGLRDESGHATAPGRADIAGSLLGDYTRPAPHGLAQNGLRGRHLQLLAALIGEVDTTGQSTGRTAPSREAPQTPQAPQAPQAPPTTVSAPRPVATTGGSVGAEPYAPKAPATNELSTAGTEQGPKAEQGPKTGPAETPAPAPQPAAPDKTPPKPTAKPVKEWITNRLAREHPPALDRAMPRPPVTTSSGSRAPLSDGSTVPAHIDGLRSLLDEVPEGVAAEALVSFGHGDIVLRGADQVVSEIGRVLRENPTVAPGPAPSGRPQGVGPGSAAARAFTRAYRALTGSGSSTSGTPTPENSDLVADITHALLHEPRSLTGEGRGFPYLDSRGNPRLLHLRAIHRRDGWQPFGDAFGDPAKVDAMQRSVVTAGQSKSMQSSTPMALSVPIGPVSSAAFGGFGRVGLRAGFSRKTGYGLADQGTGQTETRGLDGSHVYLTDAYFEMTVLDADHGTVTLPVPVPADGATATTPQGPVPAVFGFGMRGGLSVRLSDSATRPPGPLAARAAARIPRSMVLDATSTYRLVRPEDFGPVGHILAWAAQEVGAAPGSDAYRDLGAFFSQGGFHRHARTLANGRIVSPPLYADDKARTPLGAFVVDVVPGRAVRISSTADAEMRDISVSLARNERGLSRTTALGLELAAGPAFNFFGVGPLNLRFQFGPVGRYLVSWSRAKNLGGSGASKTAGQVKGDNTALYLVKKDVFVTRTGQAGGPRRFQTWSLDRMTHTEARRLAGWDDGTTLALSNGAPAPFPPAQLTLHRPRTLGMHRVEEFTYDDGLLRHGAVSGTDPGRTLLDAFADEVIAAAARAHPRLVAPLAELSPPPRRREQLRAFFRGGPAPDPAPGRPQWRNRAEYETAVFNTRQILVMLSDAYLRASLEALTTTGLLIPLYETGRFGQAHRYVRVRGELTNRTFRGVQTDFRHRFSSVGAERLDGQAGARRGGELGLEAALSLRDPVSDDIGAPNNAGTVSLGVREGWQRDTDLSFGSSATNEPMTVSTGPAHLYAYDLSLTADHGGYWRFRGLLRGTATLGLLGTQPFVFSSPQDVLIGTAADGTAVSGGPWTGRVLISVPAAHAPAADPHAPGADNPYAPTAAPATTVPIRQDRALALARGLLPAPPPDPGDGTGSGALVGPDDLVVSSSDGSAGPPPDNTARRLFRQLQNHPFVTVTVTADPALVASLDDIVRIASGGAWQLTEEGAPTRSAIMRSLQPQLLTANFDQSSGPLGWSAVGLMGKGPYGSLWATFRHVTTVRDVRALTPSVPMDSEMIIGGSTQSAGKASRSRTVFTGGQLTYAKAHTAGPGLLGTYGLVASPYSEASAEEMTVVRVAVADMNRKGFGHQVLVTGTTEHWLALASSRLGSDAPGHAYIPRQLAGVAGAMTAVPGGWQAHVPEKSAYELGIVEDGLGDVPRYTARSWQPQPWLRGHEFGTYPVNALDATRALAAFDRQVATLGLADEDRERVRALVTSRAGRFLGKELTDAGSSAPVRSGGWGWHSLRIGNRTARVRVRLAPGRTTFSMLDHNVEMEENRRAIETVTRGKSGTKGSDLGYLVSEGVHTNLQGGVGPVASGPALTESGGGRDTTSRGHSVTTLTVFRAASTEPYAVTDTAYDLEITLELDNVPAERAPAAQPDGTDRSLARRAAGRLDEFTGKRTVSVREPAGTLREHVPLSLMTPVVGSDGTDGSDGGKRLSPPDLAALPAPRQITGPDGRPRTRLADGTAGAFTFPEHGFDVRRIVGRTGLRTANHYAIALSYDASFSLARADAPRRAGDTGLTRAGTGSAQSLEDSTSNAMLTAFFHRAVTDDGYRLTDLTEKNLIGTESASLRLHAMPDFSGATLLTVADGEKMEVLHRVGEGVSASESHDTVQDLSPGAGLLVSSPQTGLNQYGFTVPGANEGTGSGTPAGTDHLDSINVKPKTGRVFVFAVPTAWVSDADVRRGVKDRGLLRAVGGTFGHVRPGPKAVRSDTHVLAWVREDIARGLGIVTDRNFPQQVSAAWDAVGGASKAWTTADSAYWSKRRPGAALYAELRAARTAMEAARRTAEGPRRARTEAEQALTTAQDGLREAQKAETRDRTTAQANVDAAHDALEQATTHWQNSVPEQDRYRKAAVAPVTAAEERARAAEVAADALRESAALRTQQAQEAVTEAETLAKEPREAAERADELVEQAVARFERARTAWESLRDTLDGLRRTAEAAAAEYHRVRAAADQLTWWHQRAATPGGRARLEAEGFEEPPPVRHQAPPKPPAPPKAPPPPTYTRITADGRTTLVSPGPDPVEFRLHDVPRDGDAFLKALVLGLSRSAPDLLTSHGLDLTDPPATLDRLRRMFAAQLTDPGGPDLRDVIAPDGTDTFRTGEITEAGLTAPGTGPLAPGTPQRAEFDGLNGLIPHSAALGADARAALAAAQILRPGDYADESTWNNSAADLLPLLASHALGIDLTVVDGSGRFQRFSPPPRPGAGRLHTAGLTDEQPGPRPHIVLSLDDRHYQLAVPAVEDADGPPPPPLPPLPSPQPLPKAGPDHHTEAPRNGLATDGTAVTAPARGEPVPVPATGECLLYSFLAGASPHLRDTLTGLAQDDPDAYAWLADGDRVREDLGLQATLHSAWQIAPSGPSQTVVAAMRRHVAGHVRDSGGRLHPQIIGQLRLTAASEGTFAARIAPLDRPALLRLLEYHGAHPGPLAAMDDAELRAELEDVYATSTAPLDATELGAVLRTVEGWRDQWMTATGEVLLPLLAHAFGTRVEVVRDGRFNASAGPDNTPTAVEVHYFGRNHYTGSTAGTWDPATGTYGAPVPPKRVKKEEKDADGDVRVNPLWTPLDEIDPDLLITGGKDAVWLYTVTADGRVLLGSEKPSDIVTREQFDALLDGMREKDPGLTEEGLLRHLDGLGHTGIAAGFTEEGRTVPGRSRVSGEFRWNAERGRWTVNDKSGRYMSDSVRPGLDPAQAAAWLDGVAGLFRERLGVEVVPDQVKTAGATAHPGTTAPGAGLADALSARTAALLSDGTVSIAELDALGIALSPGPAAQAVLMGGRLSLSELAPELELTADQRLRLLLWRSSGTTSPPQDPDAVPDAVAAALGIGLVILRPDGRTTRHGSGTGPSVQLRFDGSRFSVP
ncbi:hypothetical protein [Streptomyces poonensis]|uniref:Lonely Cys domain-containing protein n=1 Tax=Streptomyces poonensis TaxID=68255 RepID=A0A918UFM8_9ACTN|nr:hypothetical protein [Streptomyces poonensis]GGZ00884.1 hypothetical protein GCM10010365_19660 [Streptomyces poonensis]GLJ90420.1 hypothetical protein GCM10017589_30230 [Streptomyces poonensis]